MTTYVSLDVTSRGYVDENGEALARAESVAANAEVENFMLQGIYTMSECEEKQMKQKRNEWTERRCQNQ
jgi:hypothetical protein